MTYPITLADIEAQIRFDLTGQDVHIQSLIDAVGGKGESITRRALEVKTRTLSLNSFPSNRTSIELPYPPFRSITGITYVDTAGDEQTLDPLLYKADLNTSVPIQPSFIVPVYGETWPETLNDFNAVTITFVCGYGDISGNDIPAPAAIKQWMKINVADLYEHPESIETGVRVQKVEMSSLSDSLIADFIVAGY